MRAAIIAGGKGTRIRELTSDAIPKAMLPVAGVPIIVWQLRLLARYNVKHVAIMTGHLADILEQQVPAESQKLGIEVSFFREHEPLGTAGGFPAAKCFFGDIFFVFYCDVAIEMDLEKLAHFHKSRNADVTIVSHPNDHPYESDLLLTDDDGRIEKVIYKKDRIDGYYPNLVPAGVYCFSERVFAYIRQGARQDFIKDVFPSMIEEGARVYAYSTPEYLRDMGTYERFQMTEKDIKSGLFFRMNSLYKKPTIFFDRDGVLCKHTPGSDVLRPDELELEPVASAAVKRANDSGVLSVVITNQPVISKGFITFADLKLIHAKMETLLGKEHAKIDKIYFCPHHPEEGHVNEVPELKIDCECRKPKPGMIFRACEELPVSLDDSCVIGDSFRDIGAARAAGIDAFGVRTGAGSKDCIGKYRPDVVFGNVLEAVDYFIIGVAGIDEIADAIIRRLDMDAPCVVGVCGFARAGKTAYCYALIKALKKRSMDVLTVRLDDWIVPKSKRHPGLTSEERSQTSKYPALFNAILNGEKVEAGGYEQFTRESSSPVFYELRNERIVIFDGLYACHDSIRKNIDVAIFIDADEDILSRRFREFYAWKGESEEGIEALLGKRKKDEWPSVRRQKDYCDRIIKITDKDRNV